MHFKHSESTGGLVEQELLGKSLYENKERENFSEYGYTTRDHSFRVLKDMQSFDPTDPQPDFANTVHYYVFNGLGLEAENVRFFTAVKSPLDRFHGVDAWFEIDDDTTTTVITIDVTMNPNKETGHKADIIFLVPSGGLDRKVDKGQFLEYSQKLANEVIEFFHKQRRLT